jgi:sugar/nucleoside kinase (ribokinase family)
MQPLDYLVIGHVTRDLVGSSFALGGTAVYAARTAQALGCQVGVVTSADPCLDLSEALNDVLIARRLAQTSTTFENIYTGSGRRQVIHSVASPLGLDAVPSEWQARLVHVGPVARECDPALVSSFEGTFVGVTPQGWMRQWDDAGYVDRRRWEKAGQVLPHADAVVLSEEDVGGDRSVVAEYVHRTRCLALTQGAAGCTVYADGDVRRFPAPRVDEVDSTGAGDVFATSLFYALQRGHDAWMAARFANCIAARSVTRSGLFGTPLKEEVTRCGRATLRSKEDDVHHLRAG